MLRRPHKCLKRPTIIHRCLADLDEHLDVLARRDPVSPCRVGVQQAVEVVTG